MRDIREETGLDVFGLHIFLRIGIANQGLSEDEKTYGIHAADVETSILLHVHPELVNMDLAPDAMPHYLKELETPPFLGPMNFAWLTKDISESGVIGNAQTADASRGEKYLKDAADELATILEKISTFRI
jgi:creatinine amidohydrolase